MTPKLGWGFSTASVCLRGAKAAIRKMPDHASMEDAAIQTMVKNQASEILEQLMQIEQSVAKLRNEILGAVIEEKADGTAIQS